MHGITHEDDGVGEEELLDVDVRTRDELGVSDVAAGEVGGVVEGISNHEDLAERCDGIEGSHEGLGLAIGDGERRNAQDFAGADEVTQSAAQSELADGLRDLLGVVARAWSEDNTTTDPDGRAAFTGTGAASAFLAPGFFASAIYRSAILLSASSLPGSRHIGSYYLMDQVLIVFTCESDIRNRHRGHFAQEQCLPHQIDRVFLTGGTSFVPAVRRLFEARFPTEKIDSGEQLLSIAKGLALIAGSNDMEAWAA